MLLFEEEYSNVVGSGVSCYGLLIQTFGCPQGGEEQLVLRTLNDVKSAYLAVHFQVIMM